MAERNKKQSGTFSHAIFFGLIFETFTSYRKVRGFAHSERRKFYRLRRSSKPMTHIVQVSHKAPLKEYQRGGLESKYKTAFSKFGLTIVMKYV